MSFVNKVVIITGASAGIGAVTSIFFAQKSAKVVLVGRNKEKLQKVTEECNKTGSEALPIVAELTNEEDARRVISETLDKFGRIDVLVNNAGILGFSDIQDKNYMNVYDSVINTNLRVAVLMTHLTTPHLIKTKGNIVNVSSAAGKMASSLKVSSYAVSKAALDHFTRAIATELAHHGVRVNTVSPGPVKTDIAANAGQTDYTMEDLKDTMPLNKVAEPEEVADLIVYLASEKAKSITGSDFVIDNGGLLKKQDMRL